MRTFAKKPKATQQTTSVLSPKPSRSLVGQTRDVYSILHLQRTIGNQGVLRSLQTAIENIDANSASRTSTGFSHDFSRIPVYPGTTEKSHGAQAVDINRRSSGQPLDHVTQAYMQLRFGHDFSNVRIHTGTFAAESARALNARAYTLGQDIAFGSGQYQPETHNGGRLLAHELTHVVQRTQTSERPETPGMTLQGDSIEREACAAAEAITGGLAFRPRYRMDRHIARQEQAGTTQTPTPAATPQPMTRAEFERTLRDRFAVVDIHTGTQAEQASLVNVPPQQLTNWTSWDPGTTSTDYAHILRAFENFSATFGGIPNVRKVVFFKQHYEHTPQGVRTDPDAGASFGVGELTIYESFSRRQALPLARSNVSGTYPPAEGLTFREERTAPGAPLTYPTREQNIERNIEHELGHGLAEAVMGSIPDRGLDPSMMRSYAWEVGWTSNALVGLTHPGLYDIGVPAVADAFSRLLAPPVQYQITPDHWNDPQWIEQPISRYMVSRSEGEDFAEAVRTFVEAPELLRQRSPHRYNFLVQHRAQWQTRLLRPHTQQRGAGIGLGIYLVVDDPDRDPLNYHRVTPYEGWSDRGQIVEVSHDADGYYYWWRGRRLQLPGRP